MATIALAAVGSAIAPSVSMGLGIGLPWLAGPWGQAIGAGLGSLIDNSLFSSKTRLPDVVGGRLESLSVQVSTYGKTIPHVYGYTRLAGNVIWALSLKEVENRNTTSSGGGKGGGGGSVSQTSITYEYFATLAIAICEGEIDSILRVWADAKALTGEELQAALGKYEIFYGSEDQDPSAIIERYDGAGNVPAYRGTAYVVIEDFPLAQFGNRIPNFTFEVLRKVKFIPSVEDKIKSVMMIPGSGEFVYSRDIVEKYAVVEDANGDFHQTGEKIALNRHGYDARPDVEVAIDQMLEALPNLEWVGLVVSWFATSKVCASAEIFPKVEYELSSSDTTPVQWSVAGYTRETAELVLYFGDGTPTYGGTPTDKSVVEIAAYLKSKGLQVMFYPFLQVDTTTDLPGEDNKPWRGRITPTSNADVTSFFTRTNGYNRFIRHYAQLQVGGVYLKNNIDAFVIGSEMVGLTTWHDGTYNFPAVSQFKTLAANVQTDLGGTPLVLYAGDWSEYHSIDGYYHLDSLWTDSNIDVVGIDAYFPITPDLPQAQITEALIQQYWEDGEGWDYFYNEARTVQTAYSGATYAWKNHEHWWNSAHTHLGPELLTNVKAFSNAAWSKAAVTVTADSTASPFTGVAEADSLFETAATAQHYIQQTPAVATNAEYALEVSAKPNGRGRIALVMYDNSASANFCRADFDISSGSIVTSSVGGTGAVNVASCKITAQTGGFYRCRLVGQPSTNVNTGVIARAMLHNGTTTSYTGDVTKGVILDSAVMRLHSVATGWTAKLKPLWFTEYGFPSVDGCANQPNVFYDPNSVESYFPRGSRGRIDLLAQRAAINATEDYLEARNAEVGNSDLVPRRFVWTWDGRPYPAYPDLQNVWADWQLWPTGHWINGKLGSSTLGAIVAELLQRVGLVAADYDVSRLTQTVDGFIIDSQTACRDALGILQSAYFFDMVESEGILKFIPRGNASTLTIDEDDLLPISSGQIREHMEITRAQELDMPNRVTVSYLNRTNSYQAATQFSQRQTVNAKEHVTVSFPIVMGDQYAKQVADIVLYNTWIARTTYSFRIPPKYAAMEPGDVITVTVNGVDHVMRVITATMERNGLQQIAAVAEDISTYDFYTPPGESPAGEGQGVLIPETELHLLDLPAMPFDTANEGVMRAAQVALGDGWFGSALFRSLDGGESGGNSFVQIASTSSKSVKGIVLNAMGTWTAGNLYDTTNTIDVSLINGSLSSVNELALLNGANVALIGNEIIQFQTATLTAERRYTLSKLLRGRLGTEHEIAAHAPGTTFILLDASLLPITMPPASFGLQRHYKAVTVGETLANTDETAFSYTGKTLRPYSPVWITGTRDGSLNLTINWIRRTRLSGEWRDGVDVPLSEESESYEVEILNGSTVVRTISGTTPTCSYSAADQVTDFGSTQSSVSVKVYQLSALYGRGVPGEATV
jgi:hypothetical protein